MSTHNTTAERILRLLTLANTATPIAVGGISSLISIFKRAAPQGKTDEEITAEWNDSMSTAGRVKSKSEQQMGDQA